MSDSVLKQAKSQLGEASKKVVEDAGRQIADIPQEAGRHIVGMEGAAHHQVNSSNDEGFDETKLSLEERKKREKKRSQARIKELENEIVMIIRERESKNQQRIERVTKEMQDKPKSTRAEIPMGSGDTSAFSRKLKSRKGSRELGRGMKG